MAHKVSDSRLLTTYGHVVRVHATSDALFSRLLYSWLGIPKTNTNVEPSINRTRSDPSQQTGESPLLATAPFGERSNRTTRSGHQILHFSKKDDSADEGSEGERQNCERREWNGPIPGTLQLLKDCRISASLNLPKLELGSDLGRREERSFQPPSLLSWKSIFARLPFVSSPSKGKKREKREVRGWGKFLVGEVLHQSENSMPSGIYVYRSGHLAWTSASMSYLL